MWLAWRPYEWYLWFTYFGHNMLPASMSHWPVGSLQAFSWFVSTPHWARFWKTGRSTYHRLHESAHSLWRKRYITVLVVGDIFALEISATDTATFWSIATIPNWPNWAELRNRIASHTELSLDLRLYKLYSFYTQIYMESNKLNQYLNFKQ